MLFSLLLLACNKEKEIATPIGASVSQNGTGLPPEIDPSLITTLYTENHRRPGPIIPTPTTPLTVSFAPGDVVFFLTRAINTPVAGNLNYGAVLTPNDTHLVQLEITGTNFYMLADRAGVLDDYNNPTSVWPTPPNAPFNGYTSAGYRGMPWKIPPYMPAGTYRVRFYSYQGGSPVPQYLTPAGQTIAEGSLVVNNATPTASPGLQYTAPTPTVSSTIFGLTWPTATFSGSRLTPELRVMVRNTVTLKYYALSSGYNDASIFPTWDANATYPNTGSAAVRYNSIALFGGLTPPLVGPTTSAIAPQKVPAGFYHVYVDDKKEANSLPTTYLTTAGLSAPVQLF